MIRSDFFLIDSLSKLIGIFVVFFTVIIFIYSLGFIKTKKLSYYFWFFVTALASLGVCFSNNLILITIFWGFLGLTLFQLISLHSEANMPSVAKKAFIIVAGSDGFLLFGFLLYASLSAQPFSNASIAAHALPINSTLALISFILIAIGCFAKAGCMPFHTWIPEVAESASVPVVAYLPASLDKLLGIYLLLRVVKDMFVLNSAAQAILMIAGSITILGAVMMALIQHNVRKLLGYHAVSQVGYMVLGLACATPLGLAAGLFHMVNHAIYKSCLFLGAGNIEARTGTGELDNLGGLGKFMPLTFITTLIASFSISGIPPFNGFVSKWMIYQGLIDVSSSSAWGTMKVIVLLSLLCALIGSGLTLASFLKLNSGVFMGSCKKPAKEAGWLLLFAPVVLSLLCVGFGIFASITILPFINKAVGGFSLTGLWQPKLATGLLIMGVLAGFIIFKIMSRKIRTVASFVGGETLTVEEEVKIGDFYNTFRQLAPLKGLYALAEKKFFDLYEQTKSFCFLFVRFLRYLHNGVLPSYLSWCLLGALGLFFAFFK
ncbi:MAG: proton-conducting transporter membrane subunit [Candidatus Omnitrophica bacterium]|nr:proton-conducting transporter membrane subunit [Candidatus Omnitrophota bacterium]